MTGHRTDLDILNLGHRGPRIVFVHGSLAAGREAFAGQMSLADNYRLLIVNRRGYGGNPPIEAVDPDRDAADVVSLIDDEAHVVGTSMGGVVAMRAAGLAPGKVLSLTLIEPPALRAAADVPAVARFSDALRAHWRDSDPLDRRAFLRGFFAILGMSRDLPDPLPPSLHQAAGNLITERPWTLGVPVAALAQASFPKMVVSGNAHPAFEAICDRLSKQLEAKRLVFDGAGHAAQRDGSFNPALEALIRGVRDRGLPAD